LIAFLAPNLRTRLQKIDSKDLEEIRLRLFRPLMIKNRQGYFYVSHGGEPCRQEHAYFVSQDDLERTLQIITKNSWYAWEQEIQGGYLTLPGGHRVGICGQAVFEAGSLKTIKYISSLNFRNAKAVVGAANSIINRVYSDTRKSLLSSLIVSPPGCGKTTLLRDLTRQLANKGFQVVVVDERSEIAASFKGVPQLDVGLQTDVLDGYNKEIGIHHAIRGLAPEIVVTDEIGHGQDAEILAELARSGVKVMATCHGDSWEQLKTRRWAKDSLYVFELVIILSRRLGPGTIESVLRIDGRA